MGSVVGMSEQGFAPRWQLQIVPSAFNLLAPCMTFRPSATIRILLAQLFVGVRELCQLLQCGFSLAGQLIHIRFELSYARCITLVRCRKRQNFAALLVSGRVRSTAALLQLMHTAAQRRGSLLCALHPCRDGTQSLIFRSSFCATLALPAQPALNSAPIPHFACAATRKHLQLVALLLKGLIRLSSACSSLAPARRRPSLCFCTLRSRMLTCADAFHAACNCLRC
eukprot:1335619-Pleurochrysis_carterae.AAC.4